MSDPRGDAPPPAGGTPAPNPVAPRETPGGEPPLLETERIPAPAPKRGVRLRAVPFAWTVAIVADVIQWVIWPVFIAGGASPADDIIDIVVGGILIKTLGWHWSFAPSFIVKLIPVADFVPTWTMAVWIATRGRKQG